MYIRVHNKVGVTQAMDIITFICVDYFSVDPGSPAEAAGFKVGDQIMDVNGKNFENLKHVEAVEFIKSQKHIMVTLKVTKILHVTLDTLLCIK